MKGIRVPKSARDPSGCRLPAFYYGSAREGFADLLANGRQFRSDANGVLLPAYIGWSPREGSGVFDPVVQSGRQFGFYGVNTDLSADVRAVEERLETEAFSHLVLIHYFGRLDPNRDLIYRIAREHRVVVIDDLAHGFFTAHSAGSGLVGDVRLYSLHKQFPLPAGGMAQYVDTELIKEQRSTTTGLTEELVAYDWDAISSRRKANYSLFLDALRKDKAVGEWRPLWEGGLRDEVPHNLPIVVSPKRRDELYFALNESGFGVVSLYHTLIPQARGLCAAADTLSASILNLPVHQDCDPEELFCMAAELLNLISEEDGE